MRLRIRQSVAIATFAAAAMALLSGCMSVPRYDLFARPHNGVSVGPKVAALIANVQCEIAVAATSRLLLEHYKIDETGELGPVTAVRGPSEDPTDFTLYNWFKNIEYVVATTYQLEVTDTGSFNPSLGFSTFWRPAVDLLPATSAVLSVGGTLSDSGHRQ